jgi:hypothetical protein
MDANSSRGRALVECRAKLATSRKRPLDDITFGDVFFEQVLAKKARMRCSDERFEVLQERRLKIVSAKEIQGLCGSPRAL